MGGSVIGIVDELIITPQYASVKYSKFRVSYRFRL